jgi:hypothetical protein
MEDTHSFLSVFNNMDAAELERLRDAYNAEHPSEPPIKGNIWKELTRRLKKKCDTGAPSCIVHEIADRPTAPTKWKGNLDTTWLSSSDIESALNEYAKLLPDFHYVGTVPIDFDKHAKTGECLISALCSLNLNDLYKKGIRRVGIVFNTDMSTGPGQHWIAAFCDMRPDVVEHTTYFDSYARYPEPEIVRLMQRWADQRPGMILRYNKLRHQRKNAQCGMYCIYFIYCSLFDIPMKRVIPDDVIAMMRPMFFKGL